MHVKGLNSFSTISRCFEIGEKIVFWWLEAVTTRLTFNWIFFVEDKCSNCDVNGKCEKGKCVCNQGFVGEGTKGTCKPSMMSIDHFYSLPCYLHLEGDILEIQVDQQNFQPPQFEIEIEGPS